MTTPPQRAAMRQVALCLAALATFAISSGLAAQALIPRDSSLAPGSQEFRPATDVKGATAASDAPADKRYYFFLEKSYVFFWFPIRNLTHAPKSYRETYDEGAEDQLWFEALPAMHFFLRNSVSEGDVRNGTTKGPHFTVPFTMMLRLRQHGGFSSPLRSPSFMPQIAGQLIWISRPHNKRPSNDDKDWSGPIVIQGPELVLGHHSNGGPECLLLEEHQVGDHCVSDVAPVKGQVNPSGSFSTNFVRLGYWFEYGEIGDAPHAAHTLTWALTTNVALEINPTWLGLPGRISGNQSRIYGPTRTKVSLEAEKYVHYWGGWKVSLNPKWDHIFYVDKPSPRASSNLWIVDAAITSAAKHFPGGWGIDLRYYHGQDFYNLSFIRDIERLQLGIVIDPIKIRLM